MSTVDLSRDLDSLPDGDVKASLYALIRSIHDLHRENLRLRRIAAYARHSDFCGIHGCCDCGLDAAMHAEKGS